MDKLSQIREIWQERFDDSARWIADVLPLVYGSSEALTVTLDDGSVASELLLRRYDMKYLSERFPMGYIYGAATRTACQGRGLMSGLIKSAVRRSFDRGDIILSLRPANGCLYGFYSRFGFSTAFYSCERHFSPGHKFDNRSSDYSIEWHVRDLDEFTMECNALGSSRPSTVLHSDDGMETILADNAADGGLTAVARDRYSGRIAAIAFASPRDGALFVKELVSSCSAAEETALWALRSRYGRSEVTLLCPPSGGIRADASGMARIINARGLLGKIARVAPYADFSINVRDQLIPENNRVFVICSGHVDIDCSGSKKADLDVDISRLAAALFGCGNPGLCYGMPSTGLYMSLMLD